jgi:hypothetical protein
MEIGAVGAVAFAVVDAEWGFEVLLRGFDVVVVVVFLLLLAGFVVRDGEGRESSSLMESVKVSLVWYDDGERGLIVIVELLEGAGEPTSGVSELEWDMKEFSKLKEGSNGVSSKLPVLVIVSSLTVLVMLLVEVGVYEGCVL